MKPTQMKCAKGGLNQIPPHATISGDIRLTPFYEVAAVKAAIQKYVDDINADLESLPTRGPVSKFVVAGSDPPIRGRLELEFGEAYFEGVACDLDSVGFAALRDSVAAVKGEAKPYSITGSLPLVADLRRSGMDLQLIGFGLSTVYHADNEYIEWGDVRNGGRVCLEFVSRINDTAAGGK